MTARQLAPAILAAILLTGAAVTFSLHEGRLAGAVHDYRSYLPLLAADSAPGPALPATASATTPTPANTTAAPTNTAPASTATPAPDARGPFHTSAASNATYYYCDADSQWRGLSASNLRTYTTEAELLAAFPTRIKHTYPGC